MSGAIEKAILAGGCFWGMQDLIRRRPGVLSTRVGYTGGDVANATYRNHGTHAEAIEITFDPEQTSYRELLEFFFQIHDPTTVNRQGNDVGMSYRSAIFYVDDEQRLVAEDTIADVEASGLWPGRVVTEVAPAGPFWEAEPEHQDYLERYPNGYTCHFPRPGWVLPRRADARHPLARVLRRDDARPDLGEGAAQRAARDRLAALVAVVRRGDARDDAIAAAEARGAARSSRPRAPAAPRPAGASSAASRPPTRPAGGRGRTARALPPRRSCPRRSRPRLPRAARTSRTYAGQPTSDW